MRATRWFVSQHPITLTDAIKATRLFHCTDSRDHIIALLSHATDVERGSILHDNLYLLPVQECFLRFAKAQLLEKRSLTVLSYAPQKVATDALYPFWIRPYLRWQNRGLPGLPSWVPDLRHQDFDTLPTYTFRYGNFSAGGAEDGTIEIIDNKVLRCSGLMLVVLEDRGVSYFDLPLPPKPARAPHPLNKKSASASQGVRKLLNYYRACVRLSPPSGSEDVRDLPPGAAVFPVEGP